MGSGVIDASPLIASVASFFFVCTLVALIRLGIKFNKLKDVHFRDKELQKQLNWLEPAIQVLYTYHRQCGRAADYVTWRNAYTACVVKHLGNDSWARHATSGTLPLAYSDRFPWYSCDSSTLKTIETAVRTGKVPDHAAR